ncbi:MAG: GNAT family N-acetyltransferase [Chloroflexi bacterium]|nr:GNAT family N-acetyltransferase [Chloroflexota bacterium]
MVHGYLARSYWSQGVSRDIVARSIEHSLCFGLYEGERQVGFARAITDQATMAYMADVFVLEEYRGRGLGVFLVGSLMAHPALQGLRVFRLATMDAHTLYAKFGFTPLARPERMMEIVDPAVYAGNPGSEECEAS